jgi:hypothetical protein
MFDSAILEVAIGMVAIYLLLGFVARELVHEWLDSPKSPQAVRYSCGRSGDV